MEMIKPGDFVCVVNANKMAKSGLFRGDRLYVVGTKAAPIKADDPYLQRVYITAIKINAEGKFDIPEKDNEHRFYLVDPRNVSKLGAQEVEAIREGLG